jgi:hypothetical protein
VIEPDTEMQRCRRRLESRISNVYYCTNFNLKKYDRIDKNQPYTVA